MSYGGQSLADCHRVAYILCKDSEIILLQLKTKSNQNQTKQQQNFKKGKKGKGENWCLSGFWEPCSHGKGVIARGILPPSQNGSYFHAFPSMMHSLIFFSLLRTVLLLPAMDGAKGMWLWFLNDTCNLEPDIWFAMHSTFTIKAQPY